MLRSAWIASIALLLAILLTACETPTGTSERVVVKAPELIPYSQDVQKQAFDEMVALGWVDKNGQSLVPDCHPNEVFPGCSVLKRFVNDYKFTRDQIRALAE